MIKRASIIPLLTARAIFCAIISYNYLNVMNFLEALLMLHADLVQAFNL